MYACVRACLPVCVMGACAGQRTTCESQFSPATRWATGESLAADALPADPASQSCCLKPLIMKKWCRHVRDKTKPNFSPCVPSWALMEK